MASKTLRGMAALLILIVTTAGCIENDSERVTRMATEHARSQAAQSQQMVELQQEVAQGTRRLVEENAEARRETVTLQRELQAERSNVGHQRDLLEEERRDLASQRRTDPILAAALTQVGLVLACLLPLVLCWYLLRRPIDPADEQAALETLIEELASERPRFLPSAEPSKALTHRAEGQAPESSDTAG